MAKQKVKHLWTNIGAHVKNLTLEEHDRILAYTSHLPHLIAYGLMGAVPKEFAEYAGAGLRDSTRIAASSPQMWNDIFLTNSHNVLLAMDECVKNLACLRKAIVSHDEKTLIQLLTSSKEKRDLLKPVIPPVVERSEKSGG